MWKTFLDNSLQSKFEHIRRVIAVIDCQYRGCYSRAMVEMWHGMDSSVAYDALSKNMVDAINKVAQDAINTSVRRYPAPSWTWDPPAQGEYWCTRLHQDATVTEDKDGFYAVSLSAEDMDCTIVCTPEALEGLVERLNEKIGKIQAVLELHVPGINQVCRGCLEHYPCRTIEAMQ